jgi:hypothetical protein
VAERTMTEVTDELMYEVLKKLQLDMSQVKDGLGEVRQEIVALRLAQLAMNTDIHNIYGVTARIDQRIDRIERRLELHELAEPPQRPYDPQ